MRKINKTTSMLIILAITIGIALTVYFYNKQATEQMAASPKNDNEEITDIDTQVATKKDPLPKANQKNREAIQKKIIARFDVSILI